MERRIFTCYVCLSVCVLYSSVGSLKAQEKPEVQVKKQVDSTLTSGKSVLQKAKNRLDSLPASLSGYGSFLSLDKTWDESKEKATAEWDKLSSLKKMNPNVYLENKGMFLNSTIEGKNSQWYNVTTLGLKLNIAGLPLDFQLSGQYNPVTGYQFGNSNLFKLQTASLDPRERLNRIAGNFDEEKLRGELIANISNQAKQLYKEHLAAAENLLAEKQDLDVQQLIREQGGLGALLGKKEAELQRALMMAKNRESEKIGQRQDIIEQGREALKRKYTDRLDSLVGTIRDIREKLKSFGINEERSMLLHRYFKHQISEASLQEGFVQSFAESKGQLSKFHSLQNRLKSLKTGDFGQTVPGNMLNRDLFMKGLDFTFHAGNLPLTLGLGRRSDMVSTKDALFEQSAFSPSNFITYLNAQVYRFSNIRGKLSISNSSSQSSTGGSGIIPGLVASRNNFAVSFLQDMQFKKLGQLSVELSRSSNSYSNGSMQVSELNFVRSDALSSFFNTQLDQSLAVGLKHHIELEEAGLSQSVYFNYAGIGYQSTGQNGNLNTRMRVGGAVKKYLFKKKLSLNVRGDLRSTPISMDGSDVWRNHQLQTDASFRMGKKSTLRMSYNNNATNRVSKEVMPAFSSEKYQGGFNTSYQLFGLQTFSFLSIGQQYFSNYGETEITGSFFTVNLTQTILLGSNMLSANVFYNKEISVVKMMGNMMNADMAYQFSVLKHLVLSPGLTYLDNKGVARQMGIKNSIQYTGGKHFSVGGSADVRKNFYDPLFPQLYTNCRAEINFSYYLGRE